MILDLLPPLVRTYFTGSIPATLSYGQAAIFLSLGLQQVWLAHAPTMYLACLLLPL